MDADLSAEAYDDLVDELATTAAEGSRAEPGSDAIWDAVGSVVPELTEPVCRRVVEVADHEPDAELVDVVTEDRRSDGEERLRAQAVTVLVQDVEARLSG